MYSTLFLQYAIWNSEHYARFLHGISKWIPYYICAKQSHNALHFHVQCYEQKMFNKDFQHIFFQLFNWTKTCFNILIENTTKVFIFKNWMPLMLSLISKWHRCHLLCRSLVLIVNNKVSWQTNLQRANNATHNVHLFCRCKFIKR